MANLKDIRKRIGSVKNTQKITRAMKMVAAAKLRKAQQNMLDLRPYAIKTMDVLSGVAARAGEDEDIHPLLARRKAKHVMLVVLTSDRGLAGAFNANINKAAFKFWKELEADGKKVTFAVIGTKGRDYLKRRDADIQKDFSGVFQDLSMDRAGEIGRYIVDAYGRHDLDSVYLIYNEFKSAISQDLVIEPLLPITPMEVA
ncbi:MAG: ATP synthase F1 subunit gamma, partial [Deltaproteobacteria bacterium]